MAIGDATYIMIRKGNIVRGRWGCKDGRDKRCKGYGRGFVRLFRGVGSWGYLDRVVDSSGEIILDSWWAWFFSFSSVAESFFFGELE